MIHESRPLMLFPEDSVDTSTESFGKNLVSMAEGPNVLLPALQAYSGVLSTVKWTQIQQ